MNRAGRHVMPPTGSAMEKRMEFDFEDWARLAQEDPDAFERKRREAVREVIEQASPEMRRRLEGLQCRIDLERGRATTPLGACVRLNSMMWTGFHRLRRELNVATGREPAGQPSPACEAKVIPLPIKPRGSDPAR